MVFITKYDGRREEFDPEKVRQSCLRSGASKELTNEVMDYVAKRIYNGMPTKILMKLVYGRLNREEVHIARRYHLKEAIADLGPEGYEFEFYITHLLRFSGYQTVHSPEPKIQGKLVDHEIDVFAEKVGERAIIECKHHFQSHTYTGLEVPLVQWARFEDINNNGLKMTSAWIITNTKFSDYAIRYAKGKGIKLVGWNYPLGNGLERLIEASKAYPLTMLKIPRFLRANLTEHEITNIQEFLKADSRTLGDAGMSNEKIAELKALSNKLVNHGTH